LLHRAYRVKESRVQKMSDALTSPDVVFLGVTKKVWSKKRDEALAPTWTLLVRVEAVRRGPFAAH